MQNLVRHCRGPAHRVGRRRLAVLAAAGSLLLVTLPSLPAVAGDSSSEVRISARGPLVKTETSYLETTPVSEVVIAPTAPVGAAPHPVAGPADPGSTGGALRAFHAGSPWNRVLPADAPVHPNSGDILGYLKATNVNNGCVMLSGVGSNTWGTPVYWATAGDPSYTIPRSRHFLPPEFASLRIPLGAKPMLAADREMTVYDVERGYVAWLYQAVYDAVNDRWSASGGSIAYLSSNGVLGSLPGSDDPRNTGSHRGLNGAVVAARYDEVRAGAIEHALRIGVKGASTGHLWPMSGSDGRSTDPRAPKQGLRMRIKPGVDLSTYRLPREALVLATALQKYGAVVGDSTGSPVELKLEDTVQQGRGQLWTLAPNALCSIPIEAFEVISEDYR